MAKIFEDKINIKPIDWVGPYIIIAALSMSMLGLVMLFSAGAVKGAQVLLNKQLVWLAASVLAFTYAVFMDLDWLRKRSWILFCFCLLALALVLVPGLGVKVNGAQRWLGFGPVRIQPSEFAKLGLVLAMASYFASNQRFCKSLLRGFIYPCVIIGSCCLPIILQPDFGTCFLCGAVAVTMLFHSGSSLRWLIPVSSFFVLLFSVLVYLDPVRIRRVTSFLDVEANANDSGYQLWQGMLAFGVGGTNGVGLGLGRQQLHFLPEAHTDFIFPVIGEELGLICTILILAAFLILFVGSYWKLRDAPRVFEYQLVLGAILFISLQAIINMGVVTGLLPTKGMSLPFISYGGSNLVVTFIFLGWILNVFRRWEKPRTLQAREL